MRATKSGVRDFVGDCRAVIECRSVEVEERRDVVGESAVQEMRRRGREVGVVRFDSDWDDRRSCFSIFFFLVAFAYWVCGLEEI